MASISCLSEHQSPVVLDSSVVVNLNATGIAQKLLNLMPMDIQVPSPVLKELKHGGTQGHKDAELLIELAKLKLVQIVELPESAKSTYLRLMSGSSRDSLGDGEASTIALARAMQVSAVIDEKKARRIGREQFPDILIASTVDLLAVPEIVDSLSETELSEMLFKALTAARMQVHEPYVEWVVGYLDDEMLKQCRSLPSRYRVPSTTG